MGNPLLSTFNSHLQIHMKSSLYNITVFYSIQYFTVFTVLSNFFFKLLWLVCDNINFNAFVWIRSSLKASQTSVSSGSCCEKCNSFIFLVLSGSRNRCVRLKWINCLALLQRKHRTLTRQFQHRKIEISRENHQRQQGELVKISYTASDLGIQTSETTASCTIAIFWLAPATCNYVTSIVCGV